jgi:UDP-N-acetylglucosamine--N-acetylmuramyl-(pentapeptide) pyrophosphoryl-undecaprenol N-acetylglucosamine transferase
MKNSTIWFLGGTSGGHLYPLFSIYKIEYNIYKDNYNYIFFIPKEILIEQIMNEQKDLHIEKKILYFPKPKKQIFAIIKFLYYSLIIMYNIVLMIIKNKPKKIYSTGGYFSLPFWIMAFLFNIPFYIYHLDVIPGIAGRIIGSFGSTQRIIHEKTKHFIYHQKKAEIVAYPIRYTESDYIDKDKAKKLLNINHNLVLFIIGGSQGSQQINDFILSVITLFQNKSIHIIHQTGALEKLAIEDIYKKYNISSIVFDYSDDLVLYYNAADIIISRAGAGTLAEIDFFHKKAIIIPLLKVANNHQIENALSYVHKNSSWSIIYNKEDFFLQIKFFLLS